MSKLRLALWGGPSSGKTTYLAALRIAALLRQSGAWTISGNDREHAGSTEFLAKQTSRLRRGRFPEATTSAATYAYQITGNLQLSFLEELFVPERKEVNFSLLVSDMPGSDYENFDPASELWKNLAACHGLIYLFDVLRERQGDELNLDYVQQTVDFLRQRVENRLVRNRLPHYVAICISKYDDPEILTSLKEKDLIWHHPDDPNNTPLVKDPRQAFHFLGDPLVMRLLENNFLPKRLQYFLTSSIGFYASSDGRIDVEDCSNVVTSSNNEVRIRAGKDLRPVYVFEPLIWIENKMA